MSANAEALPDEISFLDNSRANDDAINTLMRYMSEHVLTRHEYKSITRSCRIWQFVLCCIYEFKAKGVNVLNQYNMYAYMIRDILYEDINNSKASENMILSNINKYIFENKFIYSMLNPNIILQDGYMHYMCLCIGIGLKKSIVHYFAVFMKDNMYYISSSNGSDYVSVPQYTSILSQEEWEDFVENIQSYDEDDEGKRQAILDYFMGGQHVHEKEKDGIAKEVNFYMSHRLSLYLTKESDYAEPIRNIINDKLLLKKKRRTQKSKPSPKSRKSKESQRSSRSRQEQRSQKSQKSQKSRKSHMQDEYNNTVTVEAASKLKTTKTRPVRTVKKTKKIEESKNSGAAANSRAKSKNTTRKRKQTN